jgi:hypothetical protein
LTRFAGSGGDDRRSLGRAVSSYVSKASGGSASAARRMGASRAAGAGLLGFLADVRARGTEAALKTLNLDSLVGRPVEDIFVGLADYVCQEKGTVDAGIARDAFIETIAELSQLGVTDLDALSADQMQTVFETYAAHAIEARICNDIGAQLVRLPESVPQAQYVQEQLRAFIRGGVGDALAAAREVLGALTQDRVLAFIDDVYESSFSFLEALGDAANNPEDV